MEYVYAAMLLHKAGKAVDEASLTKVVEATGLKADLAKVKALVAALEGVDIEKVIKETAIAAPAAQAAAPAAQAGAEKEKKKEEDEKKSEEQAAAGLGALFG